MKNLILIFVLAIGLMSFTSSNEVKNDLISNNYTIQGENLQEDDYPCRWRYCTYVNGRRTSCTEWQYGECLETVEL